MSDILAGDVVDAREQDRNPRPQAIAMRQQKPIGWIVSGDQVVDVDPGIALGQPLCGRRFDFRTADREAQGIEVLDEYPEVRAMLAKPDLKSLLLAVGPRQTLVVGMEDKDVEMRARRAGIGDQLGGQRQASRSHNQEPHPLQHTDDRQGRGTRRRPGCGALHAMLSPAPRRHVVTGTHAYGFFREVYASSGRSAILPGVESRRARDDFVTTSQPAWRSPMPHPGAAASLARRSAEGVALSVSIIDGICRVQPACCGPAPERRRRREDDPPVVLVRHERGFSPLRASLGSAERQPTPRRRRPRHRAAERSAGRR
jgi:hypothetical protein